MKAIWQDTVIADSTETVVLEGNHYFPASSVSSEYLVESTKTTSCPWKGTASYRSIQVGSETNSDAAWVYADPKASASEIAGRFAFWRGVEIIDE